MVAPRLIETDDFPFEFLSQMGERESWRKEAFRPIYYLHKWWAKRLGSVFRGIILGSVLPEKADFIKEYYKIQNFPGIALFDPFMGSGVTIGEGHKLGLTSLGRDINPVALESVRVSLGPLDKTAMEKEFRTLSQTTGQKILALYKSRDSNRYPVDTLYYFWVMQARCPDCTREVDLFPSWIIARNAYPDRKPSIQILCPGCSQIFSSIYGQETVVCDACGLSFSPDRGTTARSLVTCQNCKSTFSLVESFKTTGLKPKFRIYAKLTLSAEGQKEYSAATLEDVKQYQECSVLLDEEIKKGAIKLPVLKLQHGYNTTQAIRYGFLSWKDFFNDRQLLALGWLQASINQIEDKASRDALLLIFSGLLEFNNMFASYKGEGTGAVRHMFSHHILKPEKIPIEANVWGTPKSSGSFSTLYRRRLLSSLEYRNNPTEFDLRSGNKIICSLPFSGNIESTWPTDGVYANRGIFLSTGDSAKTKLKSNSIDLVVTDPPFFDNVHYSELADFFYAWQQLYRYYGSPISTRKAEEVQDSNVNEFARKLQLVFAECHRIMKDNGLLVFTYHHSREEGWAALAESLLRSKIRPVNAHPVKSEMSVATPKAQSRDPIQLDSIVVCKKLEVSPDDLATTERAVELAASKVNRLKRIGLTLSQNDIKVVYSGQLLTTLGNESDIKNLMDSGDKIDEVLRIM